MTDRANPKPVPGTSMQASVDDGLPTPVHNLSVSGLFMLTTQRWTVGSNHRLVIEHGGRQLATQARVTHIQPHGVDFAFCNPSPELLAGVRRVIEEMLGPGVSEEERRQEPRQPLAASVVWTSSGDKRSAITKDISRTGAFVVTTVPPKVGSEIYIYTPGFTYSSGGQDPSEVRGCKALVVRSTASGFACNFLEASAEFRMAIETLLSIAPK